MAADKSGLGLERPAKPTPFQGQGGRYVMEGGKKRLVERTEHHPQGDRARDVKGVPIGAGRGAAEPFTPARTSEPDEPAKPAKKRSGVGSAGRANPDKS